MLDETVCDDDHIRHVGFAITLGQLRSLVSQIEKSGTDENEVLALNLDRTDLEIAVFGGINDDDLPIAIVKAAGPVDFDWVDDPIDELIPELPQDA